MTRLKALKNELLQRIKEDGLKNLIDFYFIEGTDPGMVELWFHLYDGTVRIHKWHLDSFHSISVMREYKSFIYYHIPKIYRTSAGRELLRIKHGS